MDLVPSLFTSSFSFFLFFKWNWSKHLFDTVVALN